MVVLLLMLLLLLVLDKVVPDNVKEVLVIVPVINVVKSQIKTLAIGKRNACGQIGPVVKKKFGIVPERIHCC
jgi:hypothetical protein